MVKHLLAPIVQSFALRQQKILRVVHAIPPGQVLSYARVADYAGLPGNARLVARALRGADKAVPWWRVVRADGGLAVPGQMALLLAEGAHPKGEKVDLGRCLWRGVEDWLAFAELDELSILE
jgi:methylated-DNA-protein-cysteine methyltransferase related protein